MDGGSPGALSPLMEVPSPEALHYRQLLLRRRNPNAVVEMESIVEDVVDEADGDESAESSLGEEWDEEDERGVQEDVEIGESSVSGERRGGEVVFVDNRLIEDIVGKPEGVKSSMTTKKGADATQRKRLRSLKKERAEKKKQEASKWKSVAKRVRKEARKTVEGLRAAEDAANRVSAMLSMRGTLLETTPAVATKSISSLAELNRAIGGARIDPTFPQMELLDRKERAKRMQSRPLMRVKVEGGGKAALPSHVRDPYTPGLARWEAKLNPANLYHRGMKQKRRQERKREEEKRRREAHAVASSLAGTLGGARKKGKRPPKSPEVKEEEEQDDMWMFGLGGPDLFEQKGGEEDDDFEGEEEEEEVGDEDFEEEEEEEEEFFGGGQFGELTKAAMRDAEAAQALTDAARRAAERRMEQNREDDERVASRTLSAILAGDTTGAISPDQRLRVTIGAAEERRLRDEGMLHVGTNITPDKRAVGSNRGGQNSILRGETTQSIVRGEITQNIPSGESTQNIPSGESTQNRLRGESTKNIFRGGDRGGGSADEADEVLMNSGSDSAASAPAEVSMRAAAAVLRLRRKRNKAKQEAPAQVPGAAEAVRAAQSGASPDAILQAAGAAVTVGFEGPMDEVSPGGRVLSRRHALAAQAKWMASVLRKSQRGRPQSRGAQKSRMKQQQQHHHQSRSPIFRRQPRHSPAFPPTPPSQNPPPPSPEPSSIPNPSSSSSSSSAAAAAAVPGPMLTDFNQPSPPRHKRSPSKRPRHRPKEPPTVSDRERRAQEEALRAQEKLRLAMRESTPASPDDAVEDEDRVIQSAVASIESRLGLVHRIDTSPIKKQQPDASKLVPIDNTAEPSDTEPPADDFGLATLGFSTGKELIKSGPSSTTSKRRKKQQQQQQQQQPQPRQQQPKQPSPIPEDKPVVSEEQAPPTEQTEPAVLLTEPLQGDGKPESATSSPQHDDEDQGKMEPEASVPALQLEESEEEEQEGDASFVRGASRHSLSPLLEETRALVGEIPETPEADKRTAVAPKKKPTQSKPVVQPSPARRAKAHSQQAPAVGPLGQRVRPSRANNSTHRVGPSPAKSFQTKRSTSLAASLADRYRSGEAQSWTADRLRLEGGSAALQALATHHSDDEDEGEMEDLDAELETPASVIPGHHALFSEESTSYAAKLGHRHPQPKQDRVVHIPLQQNPPKQQTQASPSPSPSPPPSPPTTPRQKPTSKKPSKQSPLPPSPPKKHHSSSSTSTSPPPPPPRRKRDQEDLVPPKSANAGPRRRASPLQSSTRAANLSPTPPRTAYSSTRPKVGKEEFGLWSPLRGSPGVPRRARPPSPRPGSSSNAMTPERRRHGLASATIVPAEPLPAVTDAPFGFADALGLRANVRRPPTKKPPILPSPSSSSSSSSPSSSIDGDQQTKQQDQESDDGLASANLLRDELRRQLLDVTDSASLPQPRHRQRPRKHQHPSSNNRRPAPRRPRNPLEQHPSISRSKVSLPPPPRQPRKKRHRKLPKDEEEQPLHLPPLRPPVGQVLDAHYSPEGRGNFLLISLLDDEEEQ